MNPGQISVIIPVYNVALYLEECLTSVINQTYRNLQIICIDDGSTDDSGTICDQFASSDHRVQVIHQKNKGAGAARNAGLEIATGEYVGFVDSDDYVSLDMFEKLVNALENTCADISSCEVMEVFLNRKKSTAKNTKYGLNTGMDFLSLAASHWKYYIMVNKVFRKSVIDGIQFPEGNIIDDGFYTYQIIARAKSVVCIADECYFYRQRQSSVMNLEKYRRRRDCNTIALMKQRLQYAKQYAPSAVPAFERKMLDTFVVIVSSGNLDAKENRDCIRYMRRNCFHTLFAQFGFHESIWFILFMIFPKKMGRNYAEKNLRNNNDEIDGYFK